jgi:two-component system, response regulator PdtaR
MHALLIEDDFLVALLTEETLRPLGYSSFARADTVQEAINAAERHCPDLIVADHRIVDGTGTDAVLTICSGKTIPVVFVTGSRHEVEERLPNALVVDKPFVPATLHAAVHEAISKPFLSET